MSGIVSFCYITHFSNIGLYNDAHIQNMMHCYKTEMKVHYITSAICNDREHIQGGRQKIFV